MKGELAELRDHFPLPRGWRAPEIFSNELEVFGLVLKSIGLVSRHESGRSMFGSASEPNAWPLRRAFFELLERTATINSMELKDLPVVGDASRFISTKKVFPRSSSKSWDFSRSNGIAFHTDLKEACRRARWESVERDRVLRSWYGEFSPNLLREQEWLSEARGVYEIVSVQLGESDEEVCGVFGFPRKNLQRVPLVYGFGSGESVATSLAKARSEFLQRLAFLWGEEIPTKEMDVAPTAEFHQEYFLYPEHHRRLRHWLEGGQQKRWPRAHGLFSHEDCWVNLSPKNFKGYVVKYVSSQRLPLFFGQPEPDLPIHPVA